MIFVFQDFITQAFFVVVAHRKLFCELVLKSLDCNLAYSRVLLRGIPFSCVGALWGAADAEIKIPSGENAELRHSPFKAWSR